MDNHIYQIPSESKPASSEPEGGDVINKDKSASKTYQNPGHGIKIQYPNDWTFSEENGSIVKFGQQKYLQLDDGSFVAFYSPLESSNDTHLANLRVYAKDLPAEIEKLDGKSHLSLLDLYSIYFSHFLKYSNFTVVEPIAKTSLGTDNKSAYQIKYASGDGNQKQQQQQSMLDTFTLYNNKIYGLRYTSEPNEYSKHLPAAKTMAESFETKQKEKQNEKRTDGTELANERPQTDKSTTDSFHGAVTDDNNNNNSNNGNNFAFGNSSSKTHLDLLKNHTLAKINEDRQKFGLRPVNLSHNSAAQYLAENILSTKYMSHLTTNGEKPYMLYSKLGGLGKLRQNVAFIGDPNLYDKCVSLEIDCKKINPPKTINLLEDIMVYNDAHAKWHHRHNILDMYPTHVSLGIAYDDYSFALVQNFENNYINLSTPMVLGNSDRHVMSISGTLLDNTTRFHSVEIYYDDLPSKSFYEKYKDPNLYQPGKLVAAVRAATNVGFAPGNSNSNSSVLGNYSPLMPSSNITMIKPTHEKYFGSQDIGNNGNGNDNQTAISLVFDVTPLLKENKAGVYTVVIVLEDQNHNVFPGGAHSIFYHG